MPKCKEVEIEKGMLPNGVPVSESISNSWQVIAFDAIHIYNLARERQSNWVTIN